jgi:murein tripeptide amidase MpaA
VIAFDRYPRFPELTEWLQHLAATYPTLLDLSELGRSHEDRELWLATVTNTATGPHGEKPAIWIDGNIHASELTASVACLHLLHHLCARFGEDEQVTRVLDTRTFYVVPRVNPDGAELALAERPFIVRSTTREWPRHEQQDGLVPSDIDHDGRVLQMRLLDPNGTWKASSADSRLLVPREPHEDGPGPYFRLLREGRIQGYDGVTVKAAPPLAGIDSNRNFPFEWRRYPANTESTPTGSGDFPTSEPEVRSLVQGIVDRPNVGAYLTHHTWSGVHLRPYSDRDDEAFPTRDLWTYKAIGDRLTAITGYPSASVYHGFRYDPKDVITGVADDWAYDHLGMFAWTTEFWDPLRAAGIEDAHPIEWYRDHPLDEELQLLAWVDEHIPGGYVEWYPYDHPELGHVELGGWHMAGVFRNPPVHLLEAEIERHSEAAVFHALISPLLRIRASEAEALADDTWRVRLVVENCGWLPTNITEKAVERRVVTPVEATITLPSEAELLGVRPNVELGQLAGRSLRTSSIGLFGNAFDGTGDRAKAEWVVRAPVGTVVTLTARQPRAGVVRAEVTLSRPG